MPLTRERKATIERKHSFRETPVAGGAHIFAGAGLVLRDGWAEPASEDTDLVSLGRAEETVDNSTGANGEKTVRAKSGCFAFDNSVGADEITKANIGAVAYWVDDETVALTDGSGARSVAGRIFDVDEAGVWVEL